MRAISCEQRVEIGRRLRDLRGEKPREAIALEIGVTANAITNYENGVRVPTDDLKMKLAKYFGKTVQEIFYDGLPEGPDD